MTKLKVLLLAALIAITIAGSSGHHDADVDASRDVSQFSDDMEREEIRRDIRAREWQYEGLPIEFQSRRVAFEKTTKRKQVSVEKTTKRKRGGVEKTTKRKTITTPTTTRTTTIKVGPPNDRRYRRIYNADEVTSIEEHPYLAALLVNQQLWCGAAIIAADIVLTAAHCLQLQYNNRFFREYVKMLSVRVGSTNATAGGAVHQVSEIFFHPNYKPSTLEFNFAVLKLHSNISFSRARAARIEYSTDRNVPPDSQITFLGWGAVLGIGGLGGQVLLQKVQLPVYDLADCQEIYGRELVTRNNFCAGYITIAKNVCNHDAGGPAVMNGQLVGILSFSAKRCDVPDQPAVFSTVAAAVPWLRALGEKKIKTINTEIKSAD